MPNDVRVEPGRLQGFGIGSLWSRSLAFLVDLLVLNILGRGFGKFFFETVSRLGPWGSVLGCLIALIYFVSCESKVGNGQTIGKRLLHLRVVDSKGNTLTIPKALTRYLIFSIPNFLNGLAWLPESQVLAFVSLSVPLVTLGMNGSTLYLIVFNRSTRQGLHDLATSSYVVDSRLTEELAVGPISDVHWGILRAFLILILLQGAIIGFIHSRFTTVESTLQYRRTAEQIERFANVQVVHQRRIRGNRLGQFLKTNSLSANELVVTIWYTGKISDRAKLANDAARVILRNEQDAQDADLMVIVITRGYDLGIASGSKSQTFVHSPLEWQQMDQSSRAITDAFSNQINSTDTTPNNYLYRRVPQVSLLKPGIAL